MPDPDTHLYCTVCGNTTTVSFAYSLREGWPKCCGVTMALTTTQANVGAQLDQPTVPGPRLIASND